MSGHDIATVHGTARFSLMLLEGTATLRLLLAMGTRSIWDWEDFPDEVRESLDDLELLLVRWPAAPTVRVDRQIAVAFDLLASALQWDDLATLGPAWVNKAPDLASRAAPLMAVGYGEVEALLIQAGRLTTPLKLAIEDCANTVFADDGLRAFSAAAARLGKALNAAGCSFVLRSIWTPPRGACPVCSGGGGPPSITPSVAAEVGQ